MARKVHGRGRAAAGPAARVLWCRLSRACMLVAAAAGVTRTASGQGGANSPGAVGCDNASSPYNKANIFVSYGNVHPSHLHNEYKHDYGREGSLQG